LRERRLLSFAVVVVAFQLPVDRSGRCFAMVDELLMLTGPSRVRVSRIAFVEASCFGKCRCDSTSSLVFQSSVVCASHLRPRFGKRYSLRAGMSSFPFAFTCRGRLVLEFLSSWGRHPFSHCTRARICLSHPHCLCCCSVACALRFCASSTHRSQRSVSWKDLDCRRSSWILVEVVVCLGSRCFESLRIAVLRWVRWRCHVESCVRLHVFAFCMCALRLHSASARRIRILASCTPRLHSAFRMPLSCSACSRRVGPLVRMSRSHVARTHLRVALTFRVCALLAFGRILTRAPCIGFTCRVAW
jgi:hypothetical protein